MFFSSLNAMRTKDFDKIKPYCYILTRKADGKKYLGVRWANIKFKRTPKEDFGIEYFTSHKTLKKTFKKNPKNFKFSLIATFSNSNEAREYEVKRNRKIIKDPNWINIQAFPAIINPFSTFKGKTHTEEAKRKMSIASTGKKASKETLKKLSLLFSGKNNPNYGNKWTPKIKEKISKGIKKSFESRETWNKGKTNVYTKKVLKKMSKTHKQKWKKGEHTRMPPVFWGKDNPMYGKKHTAETRKKIAIGNTNKKFTKQIRNNMSIGQFKRSDKDVLTLKGKKYNIKNFCNELGISTSIYNDRKKKGLSLKQIIKTAHYHGQTKFINFKNKIISVPEFLDKYNISHISWHRWSKKGFTYDQMLERRKFLNKNPSYFNRRK